VDLRQGAVESLDVSTPQASFWRGKRVVLTGHSGFKGSWLTLWLARLGAEVTGISLAPVTEPNLFDAADIGRACDSHFCDIRDAAALAALVRGAKPDIVFHMAAQPLVRESYREPLATFATNAMGTAHVLDALRDLDSVRVAVMVTTDKVYRNHDSARPYREDDAFGGHDPYSASKAAAEIIIASYRDCYLEEQGMALASARAGNVIGGGDWSADRLIPDAVRAWSNDETLDIRRPDAVRPWQYVLEPLRGYLVLAEALWDKPALAGGYNFGPDMSDAVEVRTLIKLARGAYGGGDVTYGDGEEGPHETSWLALDVDKAEMMLGVKPRLTLPEAVRLTLEWYRAHEGGADARALCEANIDAYTQVAS
jgi:CDP-glucose 4,6-dehydratase